MSWLTGIAQLSDRLFAGSGSGKMCRVNVPPSRRIAGLLAVAILMAGGCRPGEAPSSPPPLSSSAPSPSASASTVTKALDPVVTTPATCPETSRRTGRFRVTPASGSWELLHVDQTPGTVMGSGTATSDSTLWAWRLGPGDARGPRHWNGRGWDEPAPVPASGRLLALGAASADRAWVLAGTEDGHVALLTWDGRAWHTGPPELAGQPAPVVDAQGTWLTLGSASMRWDGTAWQSVPAPFYALSLSGTADTPWMIGTPREGSDRRSIARWTGRAWQPVQLPTLLSPTDAEPVHGDTGRTDLRAVVRTGPEEWWVLGSFQWMEHEKTDLEDVFGSRAVAMRLRGTTWTCLVAAESKPKAFTAAAPDGENGLWAATDAGTLWHLSSTGRWTSERLPTGEYGPAVVEDLVMRDDTGDVYALGAVGAQGELTGSHGALWRLR